jgi:hypothetical protein
MPNKNLGFTLFNKLITYLSKLSKVKRDVLGMDVHMENFGYNDKNEIKMFDI